MYCLTNPGCGHCKSLAPIYERVAKAFKMEPECVVANMDATQGEEIALKYDIKGYPTLKYFDKDGKVDEYQGGRSETDIVAFLNVFCGTHRQVFLPH